MLSPSRDNQEFDYTDKKGGKKEREKLKSFNAFDAVNVMLWIRKKGWMKWRTFKTFWISNATLAGEQVNVGNLLRGGGGGKESPRL